MLDTLINLFMLGLLVLLVAYLAEHPNPTVKRP